MHAYIALALALAAPALAAAAAVASPDRIGYERVIDSTLYNQVAKPFNYVLNDETLDAQKNKGNLVTKQNPEDSIISENVILESNVLQIVKPVRKDAEQLAGGELVRRRRGYNLENVRVPARYPYLPVANFNRFRRWG